MMETLNSPTVFESGFRSAPNDVSRLKTSMKLDFGAASATTAKSKAKAAAQANCAALLASPDLAMLKMASPELEKMIMAQQGQQSGFGLGVTGMTPTPTQFLFPKNVTEEQEQYARGFIQALEQLHKTGQAVAAPATPTTAAAATSSQLVTAVDSAKAGPLPSAESGYNLTTLSSTASSSSSSSSGSSVHSFNLSPPPPPPPPSATTTTLQIHYAPASSSPAPPQQQQQHHHVIGIPRPVDLTHSHSAVASSHHHLAAAPAATLVASLPGSHANVHALPFSTFTTTASTTQTSVAAGAGAHHGGRFPSNAAAVVAVNSLVNNNKAEASMTSTSMIPQTVFAHERVLHLKGDPDGPSSASSSPPMSPINMETQERIKLDRKRARNRIAATKCRKRKLDKISHLEGRVSELKDTNSQLGRAAQELRSQVSDLKKQILLHCKSGCAVPFLGEAEQMNL